MGAAPALWIWLILGRNKECVSDFPSSCLGSAVSVHLTQPVILLLSVFRIRKKKIFHCDFVRRVRVKRAWTQTSPWKAESPLLLCRTAVRHSKASLRFELLNSLLGNLLERIFTYSHLLQESQLFTQLCPCLAAAAHWTFYLQKCSLMIIVLSWWQIFPDDFTDLVYVLEHHE